MTSNIPDHLIAQMSKFINSKMGLHFPQSRWNDLKRSMVDVTRELGGYKDDPAACIQHLLSAPLAKKQIDILAKHLTIGETYFFRDKNLFHTLEQHIFRKLIDSRRTGGKSIRIWSAGCCTGEEPYSLAILIDQMIPAWQDWNIMLMGTDINTRFLQKAKKGVYTSWSFRDVPEQIMERYFKKAGEKQFEICESLKKMVKFHQLNLVEDCYPSSFSRMDIIFCRNVLMYFKPEVRDQIIGRFIRSLSKNAYLIFSPSESPCIRHAGLHPVQFRGVTLYRKAENGNLKVETRNSKLETRNLKLETRNSKLETRNLKLETRNLKLETRNSKLETRNSKLETRNSKLET
ncbi:CheR family methyltransferase [Desulfobacterales bacterium HSG2]|nr:CheR family methyltransferase [Desulfobacterales bacterium HSG2]